MVEQEQEEVPLSHLEALVRQALKKSGYTEDEVPVIEDVLMYAQTRGNNQGIIKLTGAGLPASVATEWRQGCEVPNYVLCLSLLVNDVENTDAPLWIATQEDQFQCSGLKGLVILRDVKTWHRGSLHKGDSPRIPPCFRFPIAVVRLTGYANGLYLRGRKNNWANHLQQWIQCQSRPPSNSSQAMQYVDDPSDSVSIEEPGRIRAQATRYPGKWI